MTITDQFLPALQAYREIQAELRQEEQSLPVPAQSPKAAAVALPIAGFPSGSLMLGLADDGLPVLLDLYDPAPGPLLVAGDGGSGKTAFLQSLARASNLPDPGDITFGVLTPFPEEWTALETLPGCLGVWPAYHPSAAGFLSKLAGWAEALPRTSEVILLLFDGLDLMAGSDDPSQHDLRWLLANGPQRQVWPVLSVNPSRLFRLRNMLEYFHTRILGQVKHAHNVRTLLEDPNAHLADLLPGKQFGISQPGSWLRFWLPPAG
jgi:hypothetical protein